MSVQIFKVGGSLLDFSPLSARLGRLLEQQGPACQVLLAGGGRLADAVRHYDACWRFPPPVSHDLALDAMGVAARLLAKVMQLPLLTEIPAGQPNLQMVLDLAPLLAGAEPSAPGTRLRPSWSVTSDSIAARVAHLLGADGLWLLKSTAGEGSLQQLVAKQAVDPEFPHHVGDLPWKWINLRAESLEHPSPDATLPSPEVTPVLRNPPR